MSETTKPTTGKASTTKPSSRAAKKPVEKSAETKPTQAEQDALKKEAEAEAKAKAEAETTTNESDSEKPSQAESDKPEQTAEMADSKQEGTSTDVDASETKGDAVQAEADDSDAGPVFDDVGVLGAFVVRAKSEGGFWRSGVQFHRQQPKLVVVVEEVLDAATKLPAKGFEPECVVYLDPIQAKRVHKEPNLTIEDVELEDVIDA